MTFTQDELSALLEAYEAHGLSAIDLTIDGKRFELSRGMATPVTTPATLPAGSLASAATRAVTAPSIGIVRLAPEPGAPPFATAGERVEAGDTVCVLEVGASMRTVTAPGAGMVAAIVAAEGALVEYGDELLRIAQ